MSYLLGIGHAALDRVVQVDAYPRPDEKAETTPLVECGGGPAATAMVAAARLGGTSRFCGAVGDDAVGRRIRKDLEAEGVDVRALRLRPASRSPVSFVVVERQTAHRTIFWDRGDARVLEPEEVPEGLVEGAAAVLVDGHQGPAQMAVARRARQSGVPLVLDAGSLRPSTRELLALADHAVVSERFVLDWSGRSGREALRALRSAGPTAAVITQGHRGCLGVDAGTVVEVPALAGRAVDTNGAGDVFHGAYLVGLQHGLALEERLRLATAAAGLACRVPGARSGIPGLPEAWSAAGLPEEKDD
jgi:ribokinase